MASFSTKPKGVRLGYMGHLTLMAEDVITALEHFPLDLRHIIERFAPQPAWNDYVTGRYKETKKRDTSLLGGGKPAVNNVPRAGRPGEFKRTTTTRPSRETSADFGPASMEDEEDHGTGPPQFARYLTQELHSGEYLASDASDDEDDEDDGGWLTQSTFDLGKPPPARRHNNGQSSSRFEDAFNPSTSSALQEVLSDDPFGVNSYDDDDGFGPFSDSAAASSSDPFTFTSSSFSSSYSSDDSFDFGDFQSGDSDGPKDGDLTPTAGSWTFTSGSETEGESEGDDFGNANGSRPKNGLRTISLDDVNDRFEKKKQARDS
ncbi:hypothetical protein J3R82DRAFT_6099 [Butyriboletus roseoflavus]|nr:hypothetical protein J3R82DRAFT_6099 [Butyriboletus roseoflavus]